MKRSIAACAETWQAANQAAADMTLNNTRWMAGGKEFFR
jgi:hypothetical protein